MTTHDPEAPTGRREDGFGALGLRPELLAALEGLGYEGPTPIQAAAIGPLLAGRDVLGQAATGTGKTAAFALPLLNGLAGGDRPGPTGLVLVPTRELAVQVSEAMHRYGRLLGARVVPVYGGQPIGRQFGALRAGVDVVVATPGRAVDHLRRGTLDLSHLRTVVLDEADEMLDLGFAEELEEILAATPAGKQTVLFSATMPARIAAIARTHQRDPLTISLDAEPVAPGEPPRVRQVAYVVQRAHKAAALGRILDVEAPTAALVFCRTRGEVDELTETLNGRGYRAEALHGGMGQEQRDRVMARLRSGTAELLVATDVAARGLDVDVLTHVVNYDVPSAPEQYVHRIGRVGRAGREGVAITLAEPREHRLLKGLERASGRPLPVEAVPTVADLRSRRLDLTAGAIRTTITAGGLDSVRPAVDALAAEFDLLTVALGAAALVHRSIAGSDDADEREIPDATPRTDAAGERTRGRPERPDRTGAPRERAPRERPAGPTVTLQLDLGREAGLRPQDVVGAISNEAGVPGRTVGAIRITDRWSTVEVPERDAERVIAALRAAKVRGRPVRVRRFREDLARRPVRLAADRSGNSGAPRR